MEAGPTFTASGRQIRAPKTGDYGESLLSREMNGTDELAPGYSEDNGMASSRAGTEDSDPVRTGRATRAAGRHAVNGAANPKKRKHIDGYNDIDEMSEEDEASGGEWDSDKNDAEDEDENMPDADDEDEGDDSSDEDEEPQSLVVKLKVPSKSPAPPEVKNEDTSMTNGMAASAGGEQSRPGAANGEAGRAPNGNHLSAQPGSSPTGPSGYPTPTSTSFISTEQKTALASAPAVQPAQQTTVAGTEHVAPSRHPLAMQADASGV